MKRITHALILAMIIVATVVVVVPKAEAQEADDVLLIALNEQGDSGQRGWAMLTAMGSQTMVTLNLSEGAKQTELVHIHGGACGEGLGGGVYGLTSFMGGAGGSLTTIDATLASLRNGDMAINTHQAGSPGNYTACGNIPTEAQALSIVLDEIDDSGQDGFATLTARGNMTEAVLYISAGALESELVHIHTGQCGDALSGVAHALTSFVGGMGGSSTMVDVTLASLRTGDFAINAHKAGEPGVYTTCGNIPMDEAETLLIALNEREESGQSGWAMLTAMGSQTSVILNLAEGDLETELVHIHSGGCGEGLGGVVYGLTSFVDGAGYSATVVDASLASLRNGEMAINAHQAGSPGNYTACGNIPTEAQAVTIALDEMSASGQSGFATLTARGDMTEVVLNISAGAMQTELVHIHTGQCGDALGGVAHGLTSFVGGMGGSSTMVDATLASLRTGDFAINSHKMGDPGVYTTCGNIPMDGAGTLLIALNSQNVYGQDGWAMLTAMGSQTSVLLNLPAGAFGSELVHIHSGGCGDTLGGVVYGLTSFVDGAGYSATVVDASLTSLRNGDMAINAHQAGSPGTYTSCGSIPIEAQAVTIPLEEMNDSGQSGFATLTARGDMTEVVLNISAGAMQTELVHIHTGQCGDALGGVAHGLTSFVGGMGGSSTMVDATLASLQTGDFAINSHKMGDPGVYTTCGNIPMGGAAPGAMMTNPTVDVSENAELGSILTDTSGRTLYIFTLDEPNKSNCSGSCADAWPPLSTIDAALAGEGSDAGLLGTIMRDDGSMQVTYSGMPLYTFAFDDNAGDTNGQNSGEVWFVVAPDGTAIMPAAMELPATGEPIIGTLAIASLIAAIILLSAGGLLLASSRKRS